MLDAFIIDQLNQKNKEQRWEPIPIFVPMEIDLEEQEEEKNEQQNKVVIHT